MKIVYNFLWGALLASGLLALLILLAVAATGCSVERVALATDSKVDSALVAAGIPPLSVHKLKLAGPVTIQLGQGNTNTTVGTDKTAQRAQAVSTGDNSPVTASQKKGGVPWWVFGLVAVVAVVAWEWLSKYLNPLGWLPWRAKT